MLFLLLICPPTFTHTDIGDVVGMRVLEANKQQWVLDRASDHVPGVGRIPMHGHKLEKKRIL